MRISTDALLSLVTNKNINAECIKVYLYILAQTIKSGKKPFLFTDSEIGEQLNQSRETINRAINKLVRNGFILKETIDGKRILKFQID